jgi:hypothetical protein
MDTACPRFPVHVAASEALPVRPTDAYFGLMADIRETDCELKIRDGRQPISFEEALEVKRHRIMRCPVCHGQVRAIEAVNGLVAHLEHFQPHPGCYLGDTFDGNPRLHPRALK